MTRALVTGGLRVRGWTWLLSMLWVAAGVVYIGYTFYNSTRPFTWADVTSGIEGLSAYPVAVQDFVSIADWVWPALALPVLIAGFIRLRGWRRGDWLRAADRTSYEALQRAAAQARMTQDQIAAIVVDLSDPFAVVRDADPDDKAEIHSRLGLKLTYRPQERLIRAEAHISADSHWQFDGVRGASPPISQWLMSGEFVLVGDLA